MDARRMLTRKLLGAGTVLALCAALASAGAQAGARKEGVVKLTFATYVWQPATVADGARHPQRRSGVGKRAYPDPQ